MTATLPQATLTPEQVRRHVAALPRLALAHLPTPLEALPRFSQRLGGPPVYIKRDDCTGMLFGGNKTRHNEFLLADALKQGADVVVWGAGVQSNNCRQTAAACAKLGLECHLYLTKATHDDDVQGNLLLDHLMGAKVHIVNLPMGPEMDDLLLAKATELRQAGRRPYVWDRVTGRPLAAVSYVLCLVEILEQTRQLGIAPGALYACAAGATGAGLVLGKALLGLPWRIQLVAPIRWPWNARADMAEVANQAAALLGVPHRVSADDVDLTEDYVGPQYGAVTPEGREAIALLARSEGVLVDPAYTAKSLAALIAAVRAGELDARQPVLFLHTGGTPAVFAYRDELLDLTK